MEVGMFTTYAMKALALLTLLFTAGCASMLHGQFQNVPVTSTPSHAAIELACPGREPAHAGYTPTTLRLRRNDDGCTITLSKLGYYEETIRFERAQSLATALNVVPGTVLGAVGGLFAYFGSLVVVPDRTDVASDIGNAAFAAGASAPEAIDERTGAAFELRPREIHVRLEPRP
jgi:hypothetical protein